MTIQDRMVEGIALKIYPYVGGFADWNPGKITTYGQAQIVAKQIFSLTLDNGRYSQKIVDNEAKPVDVLPPYEEMDIGLDSETFAKLLAMLAVFNDRIVEANFKKVLDVQAE